eukprot:scaffold4129_cov82-Cyclotella_meneghiniana.AAC.6
MTSLDPSDGFVGVCYLTPKGRLVHLLRLGGCIDDAGVEHVIGTASNNAASPDIKLAPPDIFKNVLTIGTKATATKGAIAGDTPLDRDEDNVKALLTEELLSHFKDEDELYVIRTPIAHPIPGGTELLCKGDAADQTVEEALRAWGDDAAINWLFSMQVWSKTIQETLLDDEEYKKYLPKMSGNHKKVYSESPYITTKWVDEDDTELVLADELRRNFLETLLANEENSGPPSTILKPSASLGVGGDPLASRPH